MSTVEKRRWKLTVERILPCLELSRASSHVFLMVIKCWFDEALYVRYSLMVLLLGSLASKHTVLSLWLSLSLSFQSSTGQVVVPQLLLDLWNHQFEVATFCYSLSWATAVVCAGCSQWSHLMGLHSVFLQLLLLDLLFLLGVRHSLIQKIPKAQTSRCWEPFWKGCVSSDFDNWTLHKRQTRSRKIRVVSVGEEKGWYK